MTVIEKNSGTKIPYEVVKNKICFDDDLTINLSLIHISEPTRRS